MRRRKKKPRRSGYVRPSRAKPKAGWSLRELSGLTGVPLRTIRLYLEQEVLPRPAFLGSATRYQRRQLVWLIAIRRLRATERLPLVVVRKRLQALSAPELESLATDGLLPGALATALGVRSAAARAATPTPSGFGALSPGEGGASGQVPPRWARLELALGLELHVREDASRRVLELARRLRDVSATNVADETG